MLFEFLCEQIANLDLPIALRAGDNATCRLPDFYCRRHTIFYNDGAQEGIGFVFGYLTATATEVIYYNYETTDKHIYYISYYSTYKWFGKGKLLTHYYNCYTDRTANAFLKLVEVALTPIAIKDERMAFRFTKKGDILVLEFDVLPDSALPLVSVHGDVLLDKSTWKGFLENLRAAQFYSAV